MSGMITVELVLTIDPKNIEEATNTNGHDQ